MFTIADKYDIKFLKSLALANFKALAKETWDTSGFAVAIEEAYTDAPIDDSLRVELVEVTRKHAHVLFSDGNHEEFREVVWKVPGFAAEISQALAAERKDACETRYRCPIKSGGCGNTFMSFGPPQTILRGQIDCPSCGRRWNTASISNVEE